MLYYNNQELAAANHVSVRTVRNWIEAAKAGKLDLSLHTKGERTFIANTSKNALVIKDLVEKGKKFRPHRAQRTVVPKPEFYELFTQEQLYDIVSNLEINHELPRQYNYFGDGASSWDDHILKAAADTAGSNLSATSELMELNEIYIDELLANARQVNVIDLGAGNALPAKKFLQHLKDQGKMGRYIALDISPKMLSIAKDNIQKWFDGDISCETYALDFEHDRFGNILVDEYIKSKSNETANVIFFVGGTLQNFRKPEAVLQTIHDSMGMNDILIHEQKLDTTSTRRHFEFDTANTTMPTLAPMHRYIFDLLNIDSSFYEVDMGFDPKLKERYIRVKLRLALSIRFKFKNGERVLDFDKDESILLWRARQNNIMDIMSLLNNNDLYPLQLSQSNNGDYILTISRIKHD